MALFFVGFWNKTVAPKSIWTLMNVILSVKSVWKQIKCILIQYKYTSQKEVCNILNKTMDKKLPQDYEKDINCWQMPLHFFGATVCNLYAHVICSIHNAHKQNNLTIYIAFRYCKIVIYECLYCKRGNNKQLHLHSVLLWLFLRAETGSEQYMFLVIVWELLVAWNMAIMMMPQS